MNGAVLEVRNRQRAYRIDVKILSRIIRHLLQEEFKGREFEIGISLVSEESMTRANETYLRHQGPTDVITFHYHEPGPTAPLRGDLLICVTEAAKQAERFRVTWPQEVVRYIVHGLLHLCGYDDQRPAARKSMKKVENRLLKRLAKQFDLNGVAGFGRRKQRGAQGRSLP